MRGTASPFKPQQPDMQHTSGTPRTLLGAHGVCRVSDGLQVNLLVAAHDAARGQQHLGLAVLHAA
jgi:hypothetical protein